MYGLDFLLEPECLDFKKPLPSSPPPTLAFFFHSSYIKAVNCLLNIKFVQHQKRKLCKKILNNHVFNNAIVSYCSNPRTGVWYFLISLKYFVIWRACFLYQFVNHLISLIGETREATRKYHDWNLSVLLREAFVSKKCSFKSVREAPCKKSFGILASYWTPPKIK